ncbi:MAG: AAA family ATPase, partial [Sphaerospermopsis kisseleviana]
MENKNIALRERGLERINNNLAMLKLQLPALGLKNEAIKRWTPVLERWQRVIELEQSEQRKRSQGELINPFQYGNPVRLNQKDLFKGRQRFADEVVRRVLNRDRPTLVLHGPRRCGKTSFLYNLPRLFPSDILPVFVNMQSAAITNKESDFCYGLVRAIHKDCKIQGVQLPTVPKREQFENSPYTNLEDWLDTALEQIGEKRILLNLDEFEKIGTAIQEGKLSLHLFDQLRHLIQHYDQLGFLFSGVQTLEELGPNWSSYFISVV